MARPPSSLKVYSGCTNRTFTTVQHKVINKIIFVDNTDYTTLYVYTSLIQLVH